MEDTNISVLNTSIDDLSKSEIMREYANLNRQYLAQNKELDSCKQQLHNALRDVAVQKGVQSTVENDYETLQSENKENKIKISQLQQNFQKMEEHYKLTITSLTETKEIQQVKINNLEKNLQICRLNDHQSNNPQTKLLSDENEALQSELFSVKTTNEDLTKLLNEAKLALQQKSYEWQKLNEKYTDLNEGYQEMKEILQQKSEHIKDDAILRESMQEELTLLRAELMETKSSSDGPHKTKGNSLFGEVYDSRQNLQKKISLMKRQYLEMKSKYASQVVDMSKLIDERLQLGLDLQFQQTKDFQDLYNARYNWKKIHEKTIEDLKSIIATQEETIKIMNMHISPKKIPDDVKSLNTTISQLYERLREETLQNGNKMKSKLQLDIQRSLLLHETQRELYKWKNMVATLKLEKQSLMLAAEQQKMEVHSQLANDESLLSEGGGAIEKD